MGRELIILAGGCFLLLEQVWRWVGGGEGVAVRSAEALERAQVPCDRVVVAEFVFGGTSARIALPALHTLLYKLRLIMLNPQNILS
jgi:hypothetical protein